MGEKEFALELKGDLETAEGWLLNYRYRLHHYYQDLNCIMAEGGAREIPGGSGPAKVVEYKIINMEELDKTEKWLIAVEMAQSILSPKKRLFLELRRRAAGQNKTVKGREVWRGYVQKKYAETMVKKHGGTPEDFWLSDHTITLWWKGIIELMMIIALKKGCL